MVDSKTFQMYDYGYLGNKIHYGQVCLKLLAFNVQEMSSAIVSITVSIRLPRCLRFLQEDFTYIQSIVKFYMYWSQESEMWNGHMIAESLKQR